MSAGRRLRLLLVRAWSVAGGYVASVCPADNLCCLDNYPFDVDWREYRHVGAYISLYEWGVHPWDRTRERSVAVTVAPLTPAPLAVTCTGIEDFAYGPCAAGVSLGTRTSSRGVFTTSVRSPTVSLGYWTLFIEATRDADDSLHALVCRVRSTDYATYQCSSFYDPVCATSGTLTLDAFPPDDAAAATTGLELHAVFADGATIDAQLQPPPP